ncbi:glycoside hydrolase family 36 protein [Poritiphilus flavus]|uniref:Alpha-galactosidase n=1 Tax=Poritiphilus flavus TaxID=2697053 RepID=A0A6L9E808_9FLAO|nr:glycoside hydrolase family 36 protein [Poritiphilus flavus]NAS10579.1 alpha-galactosidase [Poritiphilus flavus]
MSVDSVQIAKIAVLNPRKDIRTSLSTVSERDGLAIYEFEVNSDKAVIPDPISLQWKIPAVNVKGVWKPTTDFAKRIQADWELENMESRISIDAPVINLYGHDDSNVLTFACSNAINKLEMNARLREEDNCFYCHISFFSECAKPLRNFKARIYLDYRRLHFSTALKEVSEWWKSLENLKPAYVPEIAKKPLYSTWYQFHQDLDQEVLLEECKLARNLGYEVVIIDDGWQTSDSNRGYDYTGDWRPERIPDMADYVAKLQAVGMKVALWYSVPFCGKKSIAYQKFKGKFLTENHRWAPVFDPRFPEVREYLIDIYAEALSQWKLDGFKLDFIDDFKRYADTPLNKENGRDYASINEAVDRLLTDVMNTLKRINPEVFIEFRQKYTGPAMRKYGNMFRAFDCPGDPTMNRVRIADIKMLCGSTAVHSDMVTWHEEEPLEVAALHMMNTFFGVPQLSVMLQNTPASHMRMIAFFTGYWNTYSKVLLEGAFTPTAPLANYPVLQCRKDGYTIIGIYEPHLVKISDPDPNIHLLNAQLSDSIVIHCAESYGRYSRLIYDCTGNVWAEDEILLNQGVISMPVPPCGIVQLEQL